MIEAEQNEGQKENTMDSVTYTCFVCGKEIKAEKGKPAPFCCNKEMGPLPFCTTAPNPEMARSGDADEPCDDGTQAKKK
jgi:hypothetical protein